MKLTTHLHLVLRSKSARSYISPSQHISMAWYLVKHRNNFTFTVLYCPRFSLSLSLSLSSFPPLHILPRLWRLCCPDDPFWSPSALVKLKTKQRRWLPLQQRHGSLLKDRKSIPGSRYGSGGHRDADSAHCRLSGWNSFEYWLKEQILLLLSPFGGTSRLNSVL